MMKNITFRQFSTLVDALASNHISVKSTVSRKSGMRVLSSLPIPHRTIPEPKGQDLDFVNVAHSHLIHSDWVKLNSLLSGLTAFRAKHILLKIQKDHVLSLEFYDWVENHKPNCHTLDTHSIVLHILTKNHKFKAAEFILSNILRSDSIDFHSKLFEAVLYTYRLCDSSPCVFDTLFKTFAHMKKLRNATDTFCQMKEYGFFPTVESCNKYISSLLELHRAGELQRAVEMLEMMKNMGLSPNVVSFNTLISGHCKKGLLGLAMKIKSLMEKNGVQPDVVTFNTLISGFCKEGKLHEANKIFTEMKVNNVAPNAVTYNSLISGYSQAGNSEMGGQLFQEMSRNQVKADILTYNALIWGLCKEGKTKKAAYLVKELEKENLVPNASTFSALITGHCIRKNSERAFQLYKSMIRSDLQPNEYTFQMLISAFCVNKDFDGVVQILRDMFERCMTLDSGLLSELCSELCKCGKSQMALMLCSEMEARHLLPAGFDVVKIINTHPENNADN